MPMAAVIDTPPRRFTALMLCNNLFSRPTMSTSAFNKTMLSRVVDKAIQAGQSYQTLTTVFLLFPVTLPIFLLLDRPKDLCRMKKESTAAGRAAAGNDRKELPTVQRTTRFQLLMVLVNGEWPIERMKYQAHKEVVTLADEAGRGVAMNRIPD